MGSRGRLEETANKPTSPKEILNYLDELFAYALSIGMTYEQYWFDDPSLINAYIKAEKIKQRKKNTELWLQGAYTYCAVECLYPLFNPFSKEHRAKPYLKQPVPLTEEEKAEQEREKYERFVEYMMKRVEASNK